MSSITRGGGDGKFWLDRPALIWERKPQNETSSSYWNETLFQKWIQEEDDDDGDDDSKRSVLSYRSMLTISALLMDKILDEVRECLNRHEEAISGSGWSMSSSTSTIPSIPIAVAIPEGIFLPLAITAVHALNEPIICSRSNSSSTMSNSNSSNNHIPSFSAVLLPIEPTEGAERLKHMLREARPLLALTASDCDAQRLRDLFLLLQEEEESNTKYSSSIDPPISGGLYRSGYTTKVVDLRHALCQVKARHGTRLSGRTLLDADNSTGLPSIQLLQQFMSDDSALETTSTSTNQAKQRNRISHLVFTSGTSGVPKGCISSIQSLRYYIAAKNSVHGITTEDESPSSSSSSSSSSSGSVVLLASALSFDPCLSDVLATFTARATLALSPRQDLYARLEHTLQTLGITHVLCTPSLWNTLAVTAGDVGPRDFSRLRIVALGGEPIPRQLRQVWARDDDDDNDDTATGRCRLLATFGVTEACVYQTAGEVYGGQGKSPPVLHLGQDVGIPFSGIGVRICQEEDQDCLVNVTREQDVGEVILFGRQLDEFSGYLNRPQLTAAKFVYDQATKEYHYRTGDRGRLVHSRLHILGRIQGEEGMVKINGIRVELGEVEAAIVDDNIDTTKTADAVVPIVVDCLVSATSRPNEEAPSAGVNALIAYAVLSRHCQKELGIVSVPPSGGLCTGPLLSLLRARCKSLARVVPSTFVCLPRVPVSPTGKRDRKGVPPLSETVPLDALSTSTVNCTSVTASIPLSVYGSSGPIVAAEIIDCLNLQPSSRALLTTTATFSMLGGDSLAATRVTRALYAYQYNVFNTRFLGGDYGVLDDSRFSVVQLLRAKNLGEYIDFMDKHGLCLPENGKLDAAAATTGSSPGITIGVDKIMTNVEHEDYAISSLTNVHDAEAAHLYDALLQATMQGITSIASGLLAVGADPNFGNHGKRLGKTSGRIERKQNFWSSPLHLACLHGWPCLVRELLKRGAKFNTPDASGLYPVHLAASTCAAAASSPDTDAVNVNKEQEDLQRLECVKMLLDAGAPLTMKDGNKQTVIHAAARAGHCNLLRHVLKVWRVWMANDPAKQGSLDWRDRWSRTPVSWAILNGHVNAVAVLLEMGCSPHPVVPRVNKRTSAALESPVEMCLRLYGSTPKGDEIASLLQRAQEKAESAI